MIPVQAADRPAPLRLLITSDEVAALLGLDSARAFLRQRDRLEGVEFFPPPIRVQLRAMRWRRDEVLAWINRQGTAPMPPPARNVVQLRAV